MSRCGVALLLSLAAGAAGAQAGDAATQRARIAAERAEVAAAYDAQAAACAQRFAVTDCVNAAKRARRDALDLLRRQQLLLDEAQRKQRAAERMAGIRDKLAAEANAAPAVARRKPPPDASLTLRQAAPPAEVRSVEDVVPFALPATAAGASAERQRVARQRSQQSRQAQALAHKQAVERRNAERAARGKPAAAPLPVPGLPPAR